MRIGLDLDETITEVPWMFSALTKGLIADGHEVHIITYRDNDIIDYTRKQLLKFGIQYTELHLPPNKDISPEEWKAAVVKENNISVMFDNEVSILSNMSGVHTFLVSRPSDQDLAVYSKVKDIYKEFRLVDDMLGLPFGTISAVIKHHILDNLSEVREALLSYDIHIDDHGYIVKSSRGRWIEFMRSAGISEIWLYDSGFSKELINNALCEVK